MKQRKYHLRSKVSFSFLFGLSESIKYKCILSEPDFCSNYNSFYYLETMICRVASHFNSSKSIDRLPLTNLLIFLPSIASIRVIFANPDLSSRIAILLPSGEIAGAYIIIIVLLLYDQLILSAYILNFIPTINIWPIFFFQILMPLLG